MTDKSIDPRFTPVILEVLLHCYYCPTQHRSQSYPAGQHAVQVLEGHKLIEPTDEIGVYRTTAKGRAHVQQLCSLPLPRCRWVGAWGTPIKENT